MDGVPDGLVAILFTDIIGYILLMYDTEREALTLFQNMNSGCQFTSILLAGHKLSKYRIAHLEPLLGIWVYTHSLVHSPQQI